MADANGRSVREPGSDRKPGKILLDRGVNIQAVFFRQAHGGKSRKKFGDRSHLVDRFGFGGNPPAPVGPSEPFRPDDALVVNDGDT